MIKFAMHSGLNELSNQNETGCEGIFNVYQPHEDFEFPSNPDTPIWRYLDITKLRSMLESRTLFFARVDTLGDRFEGAYTPSTSGVSEELWNELRAYQANNPNPWYADLPPETKQSRSITEE